MNQLRYAGLVGILYFLGAYVGIHFTSLNNQIALIWPPNAILLSALLLNPPRQWPIYLVAVFIAELIADLSSFTVLAASLYGLINIAECCLVAGLLLKLSKSNVAVNWVEPESVISFLLIVFFIASPLAAMGGAAVNYYLVGIEKEFVTLWRLWWLGDAVGLLVLTPLCLNLIAFVKQQRISSELITKALPFFLLTIACLGIWGVIFTFVPNDSQLFALTPVLITIPSVWGLLRLDGQKTVIIAGLLVLSSLVLTCLNIGPFDLYETTHAALLAQEFSMIFMCIVLVVSSYQSQNQIKTHRLELFQRTIESSREGVVITEVDNDQPIIFCNKAFEHLSGYSFAEIEGKNCRFLNAQHRDQETLQDVREKIKAKTAFEVTVKNTNKAGHDFWNKLSIFPIQNKQGELTHYCGIQADITDKIEVSKLLEKQVEQRTAELSESQSRVEVAADVSGLGIWGWDLSTDELHWDEQMHVIYETPENVKKSGLYYDFWKQLVHPEDVEYVEATLAESITKNKNWAYEFRIKLSDGRIKYIKASAKSELDQDGKPVMMIGGNVDVTEQRMLEKKLELSSEQATAANRSKSEFLANMSHEIRTPMNGVLGMAELLKTTALNTLQAEYVKMIESSATALLVLLNDILDLSKIEAGQLQLDPVPTNLDESVGDVMKGVSIAAHTKDLDVHYYIASNVPAVIRIDRIRLGQILFNLVGNAVKFTEKGEVVLDISLADNKEVSVNEEFMLKLLIKDTGIGIEQNKLNEVFNPFQQADNSITRKYGGTGLGLPIVKHLIELLGGAMAITSRLGLGTEIEIMLPASCSSKDELGEGETLIDPCSVDFSRLHVLAVDDNETNQRWLKDMVESWGCNIKVVDSAAKGLECLVEAEQQNAAFDVLLTDKNMPEMSGFDLVSSIDGHGIIKPKVVIMLSSSEVDTDIAESIKLGIDEFIIKPVKQSEVFDAIISALQEKNPDEFISKVKVGDQTQSSLNILLAEDNVVNQRVVFDILSNRGHHITIAENGYEAVKCVQEKEFDVILMDIQMPQMDGFEATKQIRSLQQDISDKTVIIGLSAHALKGDKELALEAGMDGYLTKPVFAEKLIFTVEQFSLTARKTEFEENITNQNKEQAEILGFLDLVKGNDITGHNDALLSKMCKMTLEIMPSILDDIDVCVNDQKGEEARKYVHKLTGMVSNLSSQNLIQQLRDFEHELKSQLSEKHHSQWHRLRLSLLEFQTELVSYLKEV